MTQLFNDKLGEQVREICRQVAIKAKKQFDKSECFWKFHDSLVVRAFSDIWLKPDFLM
jgi:hypothetical protein